jgi:hypothetical protein
MTSRRAAATSAKWARRVLQESIEVNQARSQRAAGGPSR